MNTPTQSPADIEQRAKQFYPYTRQVDGEVYVSYDGSNWLVYHGDNITSEEPKQAFGEL